MADKGRTISDGLNSLSLLPKATVKMIHEYNCVKGKLFFDRPISEIKGFCGRESCDEYTGNYCPLQVRKNKDGYDTIIGLETNIKVKPIRIRCPRSNAVKPALHFCRSIIVLDEDIKDNPRVFVKHGNGLTEQVFSVGRGNMFITASLVCHINTI